MRLLRSFKLDSDSRLSHHFMPHQIQWIQGEKPIHRRGKQVMALAEKSVRIGWTYADAFKNVRKRLWFRKRDYLFATKDYQSALEYVRQCYQFAEIFDLTNTIIRHGEESIQVNRLDDQGRVSRFTEDVKVGVITFDNGSRIIAFSANPQAMAVYGGDVGLDEFAKHPNDRLLWETAQGRVAWGFDAAVWSAHDGEDTLFNEFAQQARAALSGKEAFHCVPISAEASPFSQMKDQGQVASPIENQKSNVKNPNCPWNLYYRVTMQDAIDLGLVEVINRARGTNFSRHQFLADCRSRAGQEEIFEQSYMCNPLGASANHIVEWSAISRCCYDYKIVRLHLEHNQVIEQFGEFNPARCDYRQEQIARFIHQKFLPLFTNRGIYRLGFEVAASGQGDLTVIYVDEVIGDDMWLRGLFTCRTEDWNFIKTVLFYFLHMLKDVQASGDETGLGKQICWEASQYFSHCFQSVNFTGTKSDLGFALMNQLSVAQKRFPRNQQDIAADHFALRKTFSGNRWVFTEGRNNLNPASHCDIAWAGALASEAHLSNRCSVGAMVG